ncbi:MAG TPA: O-methyltransferase [Blastocatellia bacterium]
MNGITDHAVEQYIEDILPPRNGVLAEMERQAGERSIPIIGPAVATVLAQYARIIGAKRIFEMGSAIGYSTIWLAEAAGEDGAVYYTDGSAENAREAQGYFDRLGLSSKIQVLVGDSMELLDSFEGDFDLIFNDVDKHQYPQAYGKAVPRVRKGGLFITDNSLWYGKVARSDNDRDTEGVREFNRLIYSSPDLYPSILPIRDGLAVCLKL